MAGTIIASAIIFTNRNTQPANQPAGVLNPTVEEPANNPTSQPSNQDIFEVKAGDHILGSPNATLTVILYSDIECPFCKRFHETMQQIMDEYGKNGKVKWIYRHFPLEMLHPTAKKEAEATECAAELGGNEKFWQYLDELSTKDIVTTGDLTAELTRVAKKIGLDETKFKTCLASEKYKQSVEASSQEATKAGARGTPFGILVGPKGNTEIPGALPYEQMKQMIDTMLKN